MIESFSEIRTWLCFKLALALMFIEASALAQGTIAYVHLSTPNPDPNFPWDFQGMRLSGGKSYDLDFNNDGSPEYIILAGGQSTTPFAILAQGGNAVWAERPFDSSFASALATGVEIGPSVSSPTYGWTQNLNGQGSVFSGCVDVFCNGYYTFVDSAYCPLRFQLDGQIHYGWVRVGAPLAGNFGWIYDYAYDTRPDASIFTGVPEPTTWALALCGAAVWLSLRRPPFAK